jgi:hypothetical protein
MLASTIERISSHAGASPSCSLPARGCRRARYVAPGSGQRAAVRHVRRGLDRDAAAATASVAADLEVVPLSPEQQQQQQQQQLGAATQQHVSNIDESLVETRFIAETLLPTKHGKFRLRGYKHSVSGAGPWRQRAVRGSPCRPAPRLTAAPAPPQVDGGVTFTEPSAILTGQVDGREDVSASAARRGGSRGSPLSRGARAATASIAREMLSPRALRPAGARPGARCLLHLGCGPQSSPPALPLSLLGATPPR